MNDKQENRICQNCKQDFLIEPDDFSFYEKIKVPPPTFCPECRMIRKYLWRNERTLYRRNCDKTNKSIVSIYSPDSPYVVYDISEWWGDSWDSKDYGIDFDFTRPFFEQFKELQIKVPRPALLNMNNINSEFSNHTSNSKDCYLCTSALHSENVMYSSNTIPAKNACDIYRSEGSSNENLYECINVHDCYNCQYCFLIENSFDCYYSFDLKNSSNCFLSYNQRNSSYVFRNIKYSKDEYFEKIKEFNLKSFVDREKLYKEWTGIIYDKALHRSELIESSVDCSGNFVFNSKNSKYIFESEKIEDSKYMYVTAKIKDSFDVYHAGGDACELMYECDAIKGSSNIIFVHMCYDSTNISYCDSCHSSNELFGCVGVKKGSYMIFNKQYSKEEYFELKEKILTHMKNTGEYGEFFPANLSPFSYNETQAQVYFPLTKEEAIQKSFKWNNSLPGTYGKETISPEDLPDNIDDIDYSILKDVLKCIVSGRNYNIVNQEFEFYKSNNIPIPRLHPDERYKNRIKIRPTRKLYDTLCAISGIPIKIAYAPENRPKMIVSVEEYKKNVL
mgnify:FL=1